MDVGDYWVKQELEARGLAWTRENFIRQKYAGELPDPDDWDESDLPGELQDWDAGPPTA